MKDIFKIPQGNYFSCSFSPELLTNGSPDATLTLQNLEVSFITTSGIGRPVHAEKQNDDGGRYVITLPTDFALGLYGIKFVGTLSNGRPVRFVENPFVEVTSKELHIPENVQFEYSLNSLNVPTYQEQEAETEETVIPTPSDTPNTDKDPGQGSQFIPTDEGGAQNADEGSQDAGGEVGLYSGVNKSEQGNEGDNNSGGTDNGLSQEQEGGE